MKKTFLDNGKKENCNGCRVCTLVCPKNCIDMVEDDEGFLYPKIDKNLCIKCNRCRQICSNVNNKKGNEEKAYAVTNKSNEQLKKSSSGGVFLILAQYIIEKNGVVFGAKYDKTLKVVHDYAEKMSEVIEFCGSKYVRSDLKGIYEKVKAFLEKDRYVLFTGTPCQVSGLNKYLTKEYEKLITCDIICHANPSPKVYNMFKNNLEKRKGKRIQKIQFRDKQDGWQDENTIIEYENGQREKENSFVEAFGGELINRPSCYKCPFTNKKRISDITMGDFWKIDKVIPTFKVKNGVSMIIVNSKKGSRIFEEIKNKVIYQEVNYGEACKYNHFQNVLKNPNRNKFFRLIKKGKITEDNIIESMNRYLIPSIPKRIIRRIKYISFSIKGRSKIHEK